MDLYTGIRSLLVSSSGSTVALIGGSSAPRCYRAWQRTYTAPAIIIQVDTLDLQNDLSGHSGLTLGEVVVTCRGVTGPDVDALKTAAKNVLAGYSGTFNGKQLDLVLDSIVSSTTPKQDGSDAHWYDWTLSLTPIVEEVDGG